MRIFTGPEKILADRITKLYEAGTPVIVVATNHQIVHGVQTADLMCRTGRVTVAKAIRGVDAERFEASGLAAYCEGLRLVWLESVHGQAAAAGA